VKKKSLVEISQIFSNSFGRFFKSIAEAILRNNEKE